MYYLGIDIGGSKIRGVLWDGEKVGVAMEVATPRTKRAFMQRLSSVMARLCRRTPRKVKGVGIGVAGRICGARAVSSRNIPYLKNFNFGILSLPAPLRVDNDARAFARAEALLGAGQRSRRMLAFTIGTGIGRALSERGRLRSVAPFEYAEPWEPDYQRIRERGDTPKLAAFLGEKLAGIAKRYRADVIVLGGGVLGRRGLTQRLKAELRAHGVKAKVTRGRLGSNAAAIGAALLFAGCDRK